MEVTIQLQSSGDKKPRGDILKRLTSLFLTVWLLSALWFPAISADAAGIDSSAGIVATVSGTLNVRSNPSTGASVLTSLPKGSYVTLLSKTGSWWRIEYGERKYGYCHADYIDAVDGRAATVATQSSALNVRRGPGTSYAAVASIPKGDVVIVLSASNGWSRVLFHGVKIGYVSSRYLSTVGSNTAIKLNVPNFKQTDSRWANIRIGSSGKTMAQIGCATTAIAMMESYRTGRTMYPDAMSRELAYTASGSVYWPSHYNVSINSSGYLSRIYELLRQGKPVLFGAKNAYGKQHWVVITGHSGESGLSASSFFINDPGSSSRANLQQFLSAYPNFYKYFHY